MNNIWTEKYRPKKVNEYVFRNDAHKRQIQSWVNDAGIPHLLFTGGAGTGKTTLARVLIAELGVQDADVLFINASRNNGVDWVRNKITNFSETQPWGNFKIVLLDEADYLSQEAQAALRGVMEEYHHTVRFILTCNYENKIMTAVKSRCQVLQIQKQDPVEFTARCAEIMLNENVTFDIDRLDSFVKATYPDMRKTINNLQASVIDGALSEPDESEADTTWRIKMVELFKAGNIRDARKMIAASARPDEYEEIYRWLYDNISMFGDNEDKQDEAIIIIRNGLVKHASVADVEINLSATLCELQMV
jgi:replication factor C small subunit